MNPSQPHLPFGAERRVYFLDPPLLAGPLLLVASRSKPVAEPHYFAVLRRVGNHLVMAPCSTKNSMGANLALEGGDRLGYTGWIRRTCHVVPQMYIAPVEAVERAAHLDLSLGKQANYVTSGGLRKVWAFLQERLLLRPVKIWLGLSGATDGFYDLRNGTWQS